jgi:ADP-ribose pyrophosphatase YjhB (NUDIX family)
MSESTCSRTKREEISEAAEGRECPADDKGHTEVRSCRTSSYLHSVNKSSQGGLLASESDAEHHAAKFAATDIARNKVFGLSELNEVLANVLVHLPPKEIFRLQRVSKSFVNAT